MKPGTKIHFEYNDLDAGYRAVSLNAPLSHFQQKVRINEKGELEVYIEEMTVKDCRHIDGCVYFAAGRLTDAEMIELIELFQKVYRQKEGWKLESFRNPLQK